MHLTPCLKELSYVSPPDLVERGVETEADINSHHACLRQSGRDNPDSMINVCLHCVSHKEQQGCDIQLLQSKRREPLAKAATPACRPLLHEH